MQLYVHGVHATLQVDIYVCDKQSHALRSHVDLAALKSSVSKP